MTGNNFPLTTLRSILKEAGAKKVTSKALREFHKQLTNKTESLIMRAKTISTVKKKNDIDPSDIRSAVRELHFKKI